jgi:pimeloyl-ACP methyl ester carboxylesterase
MKIVLLHGALGCEKQLLPLKDALVHEGFHADTMNFSGHGGIHTDELSIQQFAEELERTVSDTGNTAIFGFSMGGYVALYLAAIGRLNATKIITLGTKLQWSPDSSRQEIKNLNPEKIREKVPAFASYLESLHGENWPRLLEQTAKMMQGMGENPPLTATNLPGIQIPVIAMRGEKDVMVSEEETLWAVNLLPNASYVAVPDWQHPIDRIPGSALVEELKKHLV